MMRGFSFFSDISAHSCAHRVDTLFYYYILISKRSHSIPDCRDKIGHMAEEKTKSLIALLVSIMIWSASFIGTKIAQRSFTPLTLCFVRTSMAALIMLELRAAAKKPMCLAKQDRIPVFLSALFGITIYYSLENLGVSMTTAGNASIITAVYPITTLLTGALFFHERIRLKQMYGILIAIAGIVILTSDPVGGGGRRALAGNLLLLFNGFMWGFYNFLTQKVSTETDTSALTFFQTISGAVLLVPVLVLDLPIHIGPITPSVAFALLFLAAGCSVGAYFLYNIGLRGVSAGTAASMLNLMPVFGLVFSRLILHETIAARQIAGAALVIAGVLLSLWIERR